jgi:multidrug efflux pump subunit AcrA (membrane-fusion protein)
MLKRFKQLSLAAKAAIVIVLITTLTILARTFIFSAATGDELWTEVKKGAFDISVFTTGELEAKNSVSIDGPTGLRQFGIWQIKITDLIPEGTVVKEGDYVAALDKTEIASKLKDTQSELDKIESQYTQTRLDTTLNLRQSRDELINLEYDLQQKSIVLEQSAYEPPATIRQAKLDLEKAERALDQAKKNYKIKEAQATAKMQEVTATLTQTQNKMQMLESAIGSLTINAPKAGMLIYTRDWNGKKKTVGDMIGMWEPTVATLPDLTRMITKTYVNEVDIQKVKMKQKVNISLDAFPDKRLTGVVTQVANVGEQNPKSDAKVFEVVIEINESDTTLKPSMTTGNNILVKSIPNVVYVPLECVHTEDNKQFVYLKDGLKTIRQPVEIGEANDRNIIIKKGLKEGQKVALSIPDKFSSSKSIAGK